MSDHHITPATGFDQEQLFDPKTATGGAQDLLRIVYGLAERAGLPAMPEVGIYESPELNAFATGPTKSRALVAVSSGLLASMDRASLEGVLVPVTAEWNEAMLHAAGFRQVECFWRWMNFAGWLAIRE